MARRAAWTTLAVAAVCMAGCVQSQSSRYRSTVTHSVPADRTANAEVAGAFGLRGDGGVPSGLASADQ